VDGKPRYEVRIRWTSRSDDGKANHTGRFTAARRAEVVKLDWEDVDLVAGTAHLRDTKNKNKKGHTARSRTIPLPAEVSDA
jgi:integrase